MAFARQLLAGAAVLALGGCSGAGNDDRAAPEPSSNTSVTGPTAVTAPPTPTAPTPPAPGSVTLSAFGVPLVAPGLRVLVSAATGVVRVVIRGPAGSANAVEVCPVAGPATAPPGTVDCLLADPAAPVEMGLTGAARGVLIRPTSTSNAPGARPAGPVEHLPEIAFSYVPANDSLTLVTPPLAAAPTQGECAGGTCEMSFRLTPTGRGTFGLDADGRTGQVQLTIESGTAEGRQSHTVARVGGGGRLRVRSSVDGLSDAVLVVRNLGPAPLPPLDLALVWPSSR